MCREMEQIYSEGIESGKLKKAEASALSMAADGMKVDKIAHYLNVSVQMVQKWIGLLIYICLFNLPYTLR